MTQEVHGEQESHEPQVMITMEVTDEYVVDFVCAQLKAFELLLTAFTTINQKVVFLDYEVLGGSKAAVSWECST